jgi:hypothetical protein
MIEKIENTDALIKLLEVGDSKENFLRLVEKYAELDPYVEIIVPLHMALDMHFMSTHQIDFENEKMLRIMPVEQPGISAVVMINANGETSANLVEIPSDVLTSVLLNTPKQEIKTIIPFVLQLSRHHTTILTQLAADLLLAIIHNKEHEPKLLGTLSNLYEAILVCINSGFDSKWIYEMNAKERPEEYRSISEKSKYFKEILFTEDRNSAQEIANQHRWISKYLDGVPFHFNKQQNVIRNLVADFISSKSVFGKRRLIINYPNLLSADTIGFINAVINISSKNLDTEIDESINIIFNQASSVLSSCKSNNINEVFLQLVGLNFEE